MGTPPSFSLAILSLSMSVQTTSCPASARHAPVTRPTYPQPMTERRKKDSPFDFLGRRNFRSRGARDSYFDGREEENKALHCLALPQKSWPRIAADHQF